MTLSQIEAMMHGAFDGCPLEACLTLADALWLLMRLMLMAQEVGIKGRTTESLMAQLRLNYPLSHCAELQAVGDSVDLGAVSEGDRSS